MSYREGEPPLRYVCIVCWRTVSTVDGACCGVPMQLAESDAEIVAELRRRRDRPRRRRMAWAAGGAAALSVALNGWLIFCGILGPTRGGWGRQGGAGLLGFSLFASFLGFYLLLHFLLRRPTPEGEDVPALLKNLQRS